MTVTNASGGEPMFVSGVTVVGKDAGDFDVVSENCSAAPIAFQATCKVKVTFKPSVKGSRSARLEVSYNGGSSPLKIPLAGTGTKALIGGLTVSGPATAKQGKSATFRVRITNPGGAAADGVRLIASGKGIRSRTTVGSIKAGATRTITFRIRPSRPGRIKVTFKVVSGNAGAKSITRRITVRE